MSLWEDASLVFMSLIRQTSRKQTITQHPLSSGLKPPTPPPTTDPPESPNGFSPSVLLENGLLNLIVVSEALFDSTMSAV